MQEPKRDGERHFRGQPRRSGRLEVRYRVVGASGDGLERTSMTANIGFGGAFVITDAPEPTGTKLALALAMPSGRALEVRGEVRWIADGEGEGERGMGIRFAGLGRDEVVALNEYFSSLSDAADFDEVT
jgi:uncharacterized protein (TIGR02266 family)